MVLFSLCVTSTIIYSRWCQNEFDFSIRIYHSKLSLDTDLAYSRIEPSEPIKLMLILTSLLQEKYCPFMKKSIKALGYAYTELF